MIGSAARNRTWHLFVGEVGAGRQVKKRVDRAFVFTKFEMQMHAAGSSSSAHLADDFAFANPSAFFDIDFIEMSIQ